MVEWTEQERSIISSIFANLDYDDIGPKALCRYPNAGLFVCSFVCLFVCLPPGPLALSLLR